MKLRSIISTILCLFCILSVKGQEWGIKSNLLYDATATINAGVEFGVAPKWTVDLSGNFKSWTISDTRTAKHWLVQPEARYWLCDRFAGHFFGIHAHGGQYNVGGFKHGFSFLGSDFSKLKESRYEGWFAGGGIGYGYSWILGRHWNLEAEIGLGYAYTRFDQYPCATCGTKLKEDKSHHYFGPTKAAVNIIYSF